LAEDRVFEVEPEDNVVVVAPEYRKFFIEKESRLYQEDLLLQG